MIPLMSPVRRGTASTLGLRTPYGRPRLLRLRPLGDADVEYMIDKFKESMRLGAYRTVVLGDWTPAGPPRPISGPLSVDQAVDKVYGEYGDALRVLGEL